MRSKTFRPWRNPSFQKTVAISGAAFALSMPLVAQQTPDAAQLRSMGLSQQSMGLSEQSLGPSQSQQVMPSQSQSLNSGFCDPADLECRTRESVATPMPPSMTRRMPTIPSTSEIPNSPASVSAPNSRSVPGMDNSEETRFRKIIDPPTEFQKFVKESVGQSLSIYGASLFDQVPSTFAPVDRIPVAPDYTVGPGDEIDVRLWGQISSEQRLVVDRTGDVFIPQVGRISVSGLRFVDLHDAMRTSISRVFRNFEMSVNMGQLRSIQVFVMGHARRPGTYTVSSLSTLVNALFASGGPSPQGSMRNIQLKRGGKVVTTFDLYDLLLRGDKTKDVSLRPGDVIFIPPAGARVAISGSVENAAIYEIAPNTCLREILGYAGGLSQTAAGQHAVLERIDHRASLVSENIELTQAGLETAIQDGDIVNLLQVVPRFEKTVALKGNVADAVRFPWHEGMHVSDVIPEKRALLTRNYWTEHNRLTAGSAEYVVQEVKNVSLDASLASAITGKKAEASREFNKKNEIQPPAPDINWSYAAIERLDSKTLTTRLIPFHLGKAVIEHDETADLPLQPGDVITVFSTADFVTPQAEQTRFVRLEGEVKMAGMYSVAPGETLRQLVARAGGLTDKAYLYGSQFTRESTRREQQKRFTDYVDQVERDLDQNSSTLATRTISAQQEATARVALESQRTTLERLRKTPATGRVVLDLKPESKGVDALPDIPLENGDQFLVPSTPATVNVLGTVYNQSTFLYTPALAVGKYLKMAGGPTRYADVGHAFVIRADGSVVSKTTHSGLESLPIYPGDAVVVPANLMKTSRVRNFMDWSQVVSSFGVGAAAVNVLK